jgi:hypothetical protein
MDRKIAAGAVAGFAGGLVFDLLMRVWPTATEVGRGHSMITFAAQVVHTGRPWTGWLVYLGYAVVLGALFAWLHRAGAVDEWTTALWGVLYGFGWWLVAALVLVPGLLGYPPLSAPAVESMRERAVPLLIGHLVFGAILGVAFRRVARWLGGRRRPGAMADAGRRAA